MEMQPPASPPQSECNPVGALQVWPIFIFTCAVRQGCVCFGSWVEGHVAKGPLLTYPWAPCVSFSRNLWCKKAGVCQSTW